MYSEITNAIRAYLEGVLFRITYCIILNFLVICIYVCMYACMHACMHVCLYDI